MEHHFLLDGETALSSVCSPSGTARLSVLIVMGDSTVPSRGEEGPLENWPLAVSNEVRPSSGTGALAAALNQLPGKNREEAVDSSLLRVSKGSDADVTTGVSLVGEALVKEDA